MESVEGGNALPGAAGTEGTLAAAGTGAGTILGFCLSGDTGRKPPGRSDWVFGTLVDTPSKKRAVFGTPHLTPPPAPK